MDGIEIDQKSLGRSTGKKDVPTTNTQNKELIAYEPDAFVTGKYVQHIESFWYVGIMPQFL